MCNFSRGPHTPRTARDDDEIERSSHSADPRDALRIVPAVLYGSKSRREGRRELAKLRC